MARRPAAPEVMWGGDGLLRSRVHGDVYFSAEDGLAETRLVFLQGCGLPEAFAGRARFAVGEIGFGTGLNALALWALWAQHRPPGAILHMVSIEQALLDRADAARALAAFPELGPRAARLLAAWPVRAFGAQRFWAPEEGFALTVVQGEAGAVLAGLVGRFDAWFLDGFAPARNPDAWTPDLFTAIARLSAAGARAATYSVAGAVRAGLEAAGFTVAKRPGHARKRERLEARLMPAPAGSPPVQGPYAVPAAPPRTAVVIGAGIGGAAVAHALMRRGLAVQVLEAGTAPGAEASGNPQALVTPRLDRAGPAAGFFRDAFLAARTLYADLGPDAAAQITALQTPRQSREAAAFIDLAADPPFPPELLAGDVANGAPALRCAAIAVNPAFALPALLRGAEVRCGVAAAGLAAGPAGVRVLDAAGAPLADAEVVIVAAGAWLQRFFDPAATPLTWSRGQVDWGPLAAEAAGAAEARTGEGYALRFGEGALFGATFSPLAAPAPQAPTADDRSANLATLAGLDPVLAAAIDTGGLTSRAALRASPPDRIPLAGLAPGLGGGLAYVAGGFGARGFLAAPWIAERLAAEICGEPSPLDAAAIEALHPQRFITRARRRGERD